MHQQTKRSKTRSEVTNTAKRINKNELGLMGSFEGMIKLLNDFKFITEDALTLKGRIAREVDIYVAQVIVEAVLDPLSPPEIAALMSAFVCDFKPRPARGEPPSFSPFNNNDTYTKGLDNAITQAHSIVRRIV
jgi:superfamily II RNA helicase